MIFAFWGFLLISTFECCRLNFKVVTKGIRNLNKVNEIYLRPISTTSQQQQEQLNVPKRKKATTSPPARESKPFHFHFDFSLSSMLTGVALSAAAFYYLENRNLNDGLIKSQLLSGQYDGGDLLKINLSKFSNDEKFFMEAVNRKNQELCILLLKNGAKPRIFNDAGDNLLVKLIENDFMQVLTVMLNSQENDLRLAIDSMDESTGKTPLLAALMAKKFPVAMKLLELGAKPMIPSTSKYPARSINDFLMEIKKDESPEAKDLLKYFERVFNLIS